jgi:class 3 adenylate cyclase
MRAAALVTTVHPLDAWLMANSISPSRPSRERVGVRALHGSSPELAASHPHPALLPRAGEGEKAVGRIARAFVFGDIKGFSTITEAEHRPFLDHIIGGFADVVDRLREHVEYTETAGDGVYIVLSDVIAALRCCHGFQTAMDPAGLAAAGLPATLGLRLGAHAGPVARGVDRVIAREKFIGKEVIRTARIEAVTPVGQTYVTEQFAATLHAVSPVGHACEYVGLQAMAKGFGYCRMYSLRPTPQILALLDS